MLKIGGDGVQSLAQADKLSRKLFIENYCLSPHSKSLFKTIFVLADIYRSNQHIFGSGCSRSGPAEVQGPAPNFPKSAGALDATLQK